jgi:hypothetical protein
VEDRSAKDDVSPRASSPRAKEGTLERTSEQARNRIARRDFTRSVVAAAAGTLTGHSAENRQPWIGIQLGAVSLVDEGTEQVLDILQERAAVNTLFPAVYSYSSGTAGRQLRGHPYPGHGKQGGSDFRGGNFATVHPKFYRDTALEPLSTQAPDHKGFDLLASVIPAARKRQMKVVALIQDSFERDLPGVDKLLERDFNGQAAENACKNNPYYRNFMLGLVEDIVRSYEVDGVMFVCEQQGAFSDMLGSRLRGRARGKPGSRTCFCEFCRRRGEQRGIRFDRVKTAFVELEKFVAAGRARKRPPDGYYVSLWRLMLRCPELLAWEHMYHESLRDVYRLLSRKVKEIRPSAMFGPHIWHNASLSPIYRAEQDFNELAKHADFLKIALYHNAGGPRMASYIESVGDTIYGDVPPEDLTRFHYRVLNYDREPDYQRLRTAGLSSDYVYRETKRAIEGMRDQKAMLLTGIDVDIPIREEDLQGSLSSDAIKATRASTSEVVKQAFRAEAHGVVISRKYSEMRLETLSGVGDAVREIGLRTGGAKP